MSSGRSSSVATASAVSAPVARAWRSTVSRSRWRRVRPSPSSARTARGSRRSSALLSTLLLPDGGWARILGHDVLSDGRAVRRLVNRVSVEASFFKKMSAAENLGYAARYYGMTSKETRDRIPAILGRVGFPSDRRDEPMEALSRGMQQKVALARALLTSPVVLLLDEPTTGLDPRSKLEVQEFIREIRADARLDDPALHARPCRGRESRRAGGDTRPGASARAGAGRRSQAALPRRDARGGVLRRERTGVRGGRRRGRRRPGGVCMIGVGSTEPTQRGGAGSAGATTESGAPALPAWERK